MSWFKSDPMDTVESAMKRQSWKYQRVDGRTIMTGFASPSPSRSYFVSIRHEEEKKAVLILFHPSRPVGDVLRSILSGQQIFVRAHTNAGHSREQVTQVCELLMDENYRMVLGCFERDQSDGELRLRISLPYHGTSLSAEQVTWCLQVGLVSVEVVMDKVEAILGGEKAASRMEV